jgi:hypothetical protein
MIMLIVAALTVATPTDLGPIATEAVSFLAPRAASLPGFSISNEGQPPDNNGYYLFEANWNGGGQEGSTHIASVLINRYDGDVWDGSTCERLNSKDIRKVQRELRSKLHPSVSSGRAHHKPPRCAIK